jgi:hypothetical protein
MKVINLFGAPSDGKSTTAAGLFHYMKLRRHEVELAMEYPKELVWEKNFQAMRDQIMILAMQNKRLERLIDNVDFAIAECPLLMGIAYATPDMPHSFEPFVADVFNSYENINFLMKRVRPYNPNGRRQSEESAAQKRQEILDVMRKYKVKYIEIPSDDKAPETIYNIIMKQTKNLDECRNAKGKVIALRG